MGAPTREAIDPPPPRHVEKRNQRRCQQSLGIEGLKTGVTAPHTAHRKQTRQSARKEKDLSPFSVSIFLSQPPLLSKPFSSELSGPLSPLLPFSSLPPPSSACLPPAPRPAPSAPLPQCLLLQPFLRLSLLRLQLIQTVQHRTHLKEATHPNNVNHQKGLSSPVQDVSPPPPLSPTQHHQHPPPPPPQPPFPSSPRRTVVWRG